jgi:chaperonin GroES
MSAAFKRFLPAMNRVLVKKAEAIKKTKSGLILGNPEAQNIGEIIAAGPGEWRDGQRTPMTFSVGQTVLLPEFGGSEIKLTDGDFFLFRDTDLLGELQN